MIPKAIVGAMGLTALFVGCGPGPGEHAQLQSSAEVPAMLGHGFNILGQDHLRRFCVKGETMKTPAIEVIAQLNKVESWSQLLSQLNYSVPGSIYVNPNSESAKFALKARDTHLTSTYLLKSHVTVEKEVLSDPVFVKDYAGLGDETFYDECGHKYVSVVEKGGSLNVGIKLSFASSENREAFEAGGAISTVSGLKAHINSVSESVRTNSSIEIFFHQVGGDLGALSKMFESDDIAKCSLAAFEKCENLIGDMWTYAQEAFAKSVLEGKMQTVSYKASYYPGRPRVYLDPVVQKERRRLLATLQEQMRDLDELPRFPSEVENCDSRCLSRVKTKVSSNIRALRDSIALSFTDGERFHEHGRLDVLDLDEYELPEPKKNEKPRYSWLTRGVAAAGTMAGIGLAVWAKFFAGGGS